MADPAKRLAELSDQYANSPAFWTGNGKTGLTSWDRNGYQQYLKDQMEYKTLSNRIQGQADPDVQYGGSIGSPLMDDPATGQNNSDAFGLPAGVSGGMLAGIRQAATKRKGY